MTNVKNVDFKHVDFEIAFYLPINERINQNKDISRSMPKWKCLFKDALLFFSVSFFACSKQGNQT